MKLFCLFCLLVVFVSCKDETRENEPLRESRFFRANPWKFYFLDSEGNDMLSLSAGSVLPTSDFEQSTVFQQAYIPDNFDEDVEHRYYLYNGNGNSVGFDENKGHYYWTTEVPGYENVVRHEFYVHFTSVDIDTISVRFKFVHEDVVGGDSYANITELFYNGQLVIKNDDYINGDGIFIQKQEERRYTDR